ncbi:hypothetical protein E2C01_015924 [Portunus trituberculatus]|uniref:Uncharacterized protein n=1 Tax=Portunus trituberculatus TaxID=210409 RepID=A0A5B7DPP3_PORTR|nr:hypothetical protein [Portunus trituberculatus]
MKTYEFSCNLDLTNLCNISVHNKITCGSPLQARPAQTQQYSLSSPNIDSDTNLEEECGGDDGDRRKQVILK